MTDKYKRHDKKARALFLAVIMVLSVIALSSAFAGPAAAAVDQQNTERIINGGDTTVTNGTTVTVTVNGAFNQSTGNATLLDNVNGQGINDSEVDINDADGGFGTVSSGPTVFVSYNTRSNLGLNSNNFTVTYNVTIPQDTPVGTTISFKGTVTDLDEGDNASVGGDTQIEVVQQQPPTATVTFNNKTVQNGSTSVDVANATFNGTEPFNVVVHQASDENDDGTIQAREIGTKIGESAELNSGTRTDISVNISKQVDPNEDVSQLTANQTLVAMLHTTNTNDGDNIVHTAAISRGGTPVFDQAEITVSTNTDVTVGGQEVPAEFTSETDDGDQTVTSDDAVDAIRAFFDPDRDVDSDTAVSVIRAFLQS